MKCVHKSIESSLDRFSEVHWQIHQIEQHYHSPERVRFPFNGFIRAIKEIPQILSMELQNRNDYDTIIKPKLETLERDPLFSLLSIKRNYIVHKGMLDIHSSGTIGTTEGKGFKIGFPFPVAPWETSDDAYSRFIKACQSEIIAGFALLLSGYATWQTISFNKKQESLVETQEKLNNLLLEKEEVQVLSDKQADLGASFIKLGRSKYRLKIWNKGNACARNVRLNFPEGNNVLIQSEIDEKFPLECLTCISHKAV